MYIKNEKMKNEMKKLFQVKFPKKKQNDNNYNYKKVNIIIMK